MIRLLPLAALVAASALALTVVTVAATQRPPSSLDDNIDDATSGERFSLLSFELQNLFANALGQVGAFFDGRDRAGAAADEVVERYFGLRAEIAALSSGDPRLHLLGNERARLENQVEEILEMRIADAFRRAGLSRSLPLFGDRQILWPPVDVELTPPPRVLAVSPRDEIRLLRTVLLSPNLTREQVAAMEAVIERDDRFSALVDRVGGLAAYPSIVIDTRSYASTVQTVAHEWVHHYLFFYPLGFAFWDSNDLRTINETVADLVAQEIAPLVFAANPDVRLPPPPPRDRSESDAILNRLRLDVDALLAEGNVAEAEALMEETRLRLIDLNRPFRRINQAFFAFNGVYGTRPTSSSPLGPLLTGLRAQSDSLRAFVAAVRDVDSVAELTALAGAPD